MNREPCLCFRTGLIALLLGMLGAAQGHAGDEIQYASQEYKKLTSFEASVLSDADAKFAKKQYESAGAGYASFIVEFPTSQAVAYALMKRARCLHLQGQRYKAIREYQEVLDYFKNQVAYAAPSVYYQGLCHWQNGDEAKAVTVWITMAEDKAYARHPLAADALNRLGEYLVRHDRVEESVGYYRQVAVTFRRSNGDAARGAMHQVQHHYVRRAPDEEKLRQFYRDVQGFDRNPRQAPEELREDRTYWGEVARLVESRDFSSFSDEQRAERKTYFGYWAKCMDGRLGDWDDYQIKLAGFHLIADGNREAFHRRMDEQFARGASGDDYPRIIRWIREYRGHKEKQLEYYRRVDFAKMENDEVVALVRAVYETIGDTAMGANAMQKVRWDELSDDAKADLVWRVLYRYDPGRIEYVCQRFNDPIRGKSELLSYYSRIRDTEKGIPLADELAKEEQYAAAALTIKAEMLEQLKRWDAAITTWRQVNDPPETDFNVARCLERKGQVDAAIGQLSTIEGFFEADQRRNYAPRAALAIAHVLKRAKQKERYQATLQRVLRKYPKSNESGQAHRELEEMGVHVKIGGGDFEKE